MSILVPYRGIVEIVADHDVGKTIAALQTVYPYKKTIFVDDDVKGDGTVKQMKEGGVEFEKYIPLGDMRAKLGEAPSPKQLLRDIVYPTVNEISSSKHEVIIWDTWRIVYQAARLYVEKNQNEFKDVVTWRGTSTIIMGLVSRVARMIEQNQLNKLRNSCDLLLVTHHLKDNYQQNVVVGRIPESSATFSEVSNMRLWLRRNTQSKVPIIIFMKRPNLPVVKKGRPIFVNIVPEKITPTAKDESIWDAIHRYEENPIESRPPREDEMLTPEERAMVTGTLSPEQKLYMLEMLKYQKQEEEIVAQLSGTQDQTTEKKEEVKEGYPANAVQLLGKAWSELKFDLKKVEATLKIPFAEIKETFTPNYWDQLVAAQNGENNEQSTDKKKSKK